MIRSSCTYFFLCVLACAACVDVAICDDKKNPDESDLVRDVVKLRGGDIDESSGLAVSNRRKKRWWTHNDSGGKSRLYAYSHKGKRTGKCDLEQVKAKDWEDMAAFEIDGAAKLIVGDCGDNLAKRKSISLYVFDEPDPNESTDIDRFQKIELTYSDGPRDCEAITVDTASKKIVLIEKAVLPFAGIYTIDIPESTQRPTTIEVVAERIGTLNIPMISGMDIDSVNGDVWAVNYFQAYQFTRSDKQPNLAAQLSKLPKTFDLPKWRQVEAVAVDKIHQPWLTSEGKDAPLGRLNLNRPR